MAAPSSYTEATLKAYMHGVTGNLASKEILNWTVASGSYDEAVNEALLSYGTSDIATIQGADNLRLLRALARRELWRAVVQATAGQFDYRHADSGALYDRSQIHKHALAMLALATQDVADLGGSDVYEVEMYEITYADDLYTPYDSDGDNEWSRVN